MSHNSLRSHRVIVASLFLPHTAVLGESQPNTPAGAAKAAGLSLPEVMKRLQQEPGKKLKSIVDDLKDRVGHPFVCSPLMS
jgi:trehalose 6-phosphate synthase complex regulatory subunit